MLPFLYITADGSCHDLMGPHQHFWFGPGCSVAKNGPVVRAMVGLARKLGVHLIIPRTDGVTEGDLRYFNDFLEELGDEDVVFCSTNHSLGMTQPMVQIPGDDWIFEHGQHLAAGRLPMYHHEIDLRVPYESKDSRLYWAGSFSGDGRRWRLVERLKDARNTRVRMVERWGQAAKAFVKKHPSLVVPIQPMSELGCYQKLLCIDGNGVASNSTLNALLDVVYVFHGVQEPMWMRFAEEDVHYLRIREDYSNVDAVLAELDDPERCQSLRGALNTFMRDFIQPENVLALVEADILQALRCTQQPSR